MFQEDAPLLFRPQLDWRQWMWGLAFLRECLPGRLAPNIRAMVRMAEYSRATLRAMRADLGIQYDHLERGILNFYRDPQEFENSQRAAGLMRDFGVERRVVSADEVIAIEPALAPHRNTIVGGDYTPEDESGDVHLFTVALAEHCARAGVEFRYNTQATRLLTAGGNVQGVELIDPDGRYGTLSADAYVVAMGSFSPPCCVHWASCNVYPAKGYSATFPIVRPDAAPVVSLTDSSHKIVFSRLGDRLRMAGTAELSGYSRGLNTARCEALTRLARQLFPTRSISSASYCRACARPRLPTCPSSAAVVSPICMSTRDTVRSAGRWVLAAGPWLTWSAGASLNRNFLSLVCEPMKKLQLAGVARAMFASRRAWVFGAAMAAAGVAHAAPWKSRSGIR